MNITRFYLTNTSIPVFIDTKYAEEVLKYRWFFSASNNAILRSPGNKQLKRLIFELDSNWKNIYSDVKHRDGDIFNCVVSNLILTLRKERKPTFNKPVYHNKTHKGLYIPIPCRKFF